jgi:hypothetical protein
MASGTAKSYSLFTQSDGVGGSAGWVAVSSVEEVTSKFGAEAADASRRGTFKGYRPGQVDIGLSVSAIYDPTDTALAALIAAAGSGATIGVFASDTSDSSTGKGPVFDAIVTNLERPEPLDGAVKVTFDLVPDADSADAPEWTTSGV